MDMIIGIRYQNIYPELIYTYPNGLAVYKTKLLPHSSDEVLCVGGPVSTLEGIIENCGGHSAAVIGHMTQFITALKSHVPKAEYFPGNEDFENHAEKELDYDMVESSREVKDKLIEEDFDIKNSSTAIQNELEKYAKIQESGLDRGFKCVKCRGCDECLKGSGYEKISLKQEYEQNLIKQSVHIDDEKGMAIARLPFKADPTQFLADNYHVAHKRLNNICNKYSKDQDVKNKILAGLDKLRSKGHVKYYEDLNAEQISMLDNASSSYVIPWDVQFKGNSLSTPVRIVLDASSKTSTGYSLNDVLAVGVPNLVMLMDVLLDFMMGPVAFVGDVSQFYPSVALEEDSWPYQKMILREDLNPNGKLINAVIVACIFGVCSSGGQTEEVCRMLAEKVKDDFPEVAKLLTRSRYVDDVLKSLKSI